MSVLVFDIETIPDLESGRTLYDLHGLSDDDTVSALNTLRREKTGHDFLPHHLQKVVAISLVMSHGDQFKVWSLGDEQADEKELITRFFKGLEKHTPTLVSWNGSGFDLPVLHYRSLLHGIQAPLYWEIGENHSPFRWNNYLNRFHYRHLDLMDVLAAYQNKAFAPLDEIAQMLGFPGKMGMKGNQVWPQYQSGQLSQIRDYCETDVLNTYCVYCRFELIRGVIDRDTYQQRLIVMQQALKQANKPHFEEFLSRINPSALL